MSAVVDTSFWFCLVVGVYQIMIGFPLLVRPIGTSRWIEKACKDDVSIRAFCFFFVVLAISVLMENPAIGFDNAGLIRALAWLVAIECFAYCWWSHELMGLVTWFCSRPRLMRAFGVVGLAIGGWLLLVGIQ